MQRHATLPAASAVSAPWGWTDGRVQNSRRLAEDSLVEAVMPAACWTHAFSACSSLDLTVFVLGLAARAACDERIPND